MYARQVCFLKQGVSVLESNTTNTVEHSQKHHGNTLNISRPQILRKKMTRINKQCWKTLGSTRTLAPESNQVKWLHLLFLINNCFRLW